MNAILKTDNYDSTGLFVVSAENTSNTSPEKSTLRPIQHGIIQ